ncbi:hypothetical protein AVDCRST_MAG94-3436, partial [uncultured Leptolyngbya sp.]
LLISSWNASKPCAKWESCRNSLKKSHSTEFVNACKRCLGF